VKPKSSLISKSTSWKATVFIGCMIFVQKAINWLIFENFLIKFHGHTFETPLKKGYEKLIFSDF
jgi:hypothetical protein